jgi:predicted RNA-binding protein Jag
MKEYTAKTVEEAIALACGELGIEENRLIFEVKEEKKGLSPHPDTYSDVINIRLPP